MASKTLPAAIAAVVIAVGVGVTQAQAQSQEKVRFAYCVQIHMANMMLMQQYAKKCGVDVEPYPIRRYADIQLALTTKQVDMAALGYVNVGLMEEKGFKDYTVVGGVFRGGQGLVIRSDVPVKKWKDLEGKTIGTAPNSYVELLFKTTAILNGVDMSKVKTISFATGGPPAVLALRDKQIDGFAMWEPTNADAVLSGAGVYSTLDIGDNPTRHVNGLLAANTEFASKHKAAVTCMVRALVQTTDALNANPELYQQTAQRGTGANLDVIKTAIPHGTLDYKLYQREGKALLGMLVKAKITATDTTAAIDRSFDYSYLMNVTGKSKHDLGGE
ncbi:MAG: ABC transporter substrate-binding protein [Herbaspirillum sp.]